MRTKLTRRVTALAVSGLLMGLVLTNPAQAQEAAGGWHGVLVAGPNVLRVVVKVQAVSRWAKPVTLLEIKADPQLKDWELVRNSRLSVVPVSAVQWQRVEELARVDD